MTRYVTIDRAAELTGYTKRAIDTKIDRGVWVEGRQWIKAPDNRRLIDMQGYEQWASQHIRESRGVMVSSGYTSPEREYWNGTRSI